MGNFQSQIFECSNNKTKPKKYEIQYLKRDCKDLKIVDL